VLLAGRYIMRDAAQMPSDGVFVVVGAWSRVFAELFLRLITYYSEMKLIARSVPPNVKLDVELARRQADMQLRLVFWIGHSGLFHVQRQPAWSCFACTC